MKKVLSFMLLLMIAWAAEAQILTPVKWKIKLEDSDSSVKTLLFSAKLDNGWHLYDMNLPEGGPISTSFNYETLKGAKTVGSPVPSKKATTVYDEQFEMNLSWYAHEVSFTQKLEITNPKAFKVEGYVEFMACNDENCLPPDKESFSFNQSNINVEKTLQLRSWLIQLVSLRRFLKMSLSLSRTRQRIQWAQVLLLSIPICGNRLSRS